MVSRGESGLDQRSQMLVRCRGRDRAREPDRKRSRRTASAPAARRAGSGKVRDPRGQRRLEARGQPMPAQRLVVGRPDPRSSSRSTRGRRRAAATRRSIRDASWRAPSMRLAQRLRAGARGDVPRSGAPRLPASVRFEAIASDHGISSVARPEGVPVPDRPATTHSTSPPEGWSTSRRRNARAIGIETIDLVDEDHQGSAPAGDAIDPANRRFEQGLARDSFSSASALPSATPPPSARLRHRGEIVAGLGGETAQQRDRGLARAGQRAAGQGDHAASSERRPRREFPQHRRLAHSRDALELDDARTPRWRRPVAARAAPARAPGPPPRCCAVARPAVSAPQDECPRARGAPRARVARALTGLGREQRSISRISPAGVPASSRGVELGGPFCWSRSSAGTSCPSNAGRPAISV